MIVKKKPSKHGTGEQKIRMNNAELISKLVDILEELREVCEDCQEFSCDECKYKMIREGEKDV